MTGTEDAFAETTRSEKPRAAMRSQMRFQEPARHDEIVEHPDDRAADPETVDQDGFRRQGAAGAGCSPAPVRYAVNAVRVRRRRAIRTR